MNYSLKQRVIGVLEKYCDCWLSDDDWWYGLWDCDINVYNNEERAFIISVYGLTPTSDDLYETYTFLVDIYPQEKYIQIQVI